MSKYHTEDQANYLLKNNLLGATSYDELKQLEAVAFSLRSTQLELEGITWLFPLTVESIQKLHFLLFQDVYPFAGEIREVQLMKGKTRFCQAQFIKENLMTLCQRLNNEEKWENVNKAASRLSYYKAELNIIHPFREGNGRTIRIIIREIARHFGFEWHFEKIERDLYLKAMIQSIVDDSLLRELMNRTLIKLQ